MSDRVLWEMLMRLSVEEPPQEQKCKDGPGDRENVHRLGLCDCGVKA